MTVFGASSSRTYYQSLSCGLQSHQRSRGTLLEHSLTESYQETSPGRAPIDWSTSLACVIDQPQTLDDARDRCYGAASVDDGQAVVLAGGGSLNLVALKLDSNGNELWKWEVGCLMFGDIMLSATRRVQPRLVQGGVLALLSLSADVVCSRSSTSTRLADLLCPWVSSKLRGSFLG